MSRHKSLDIDVELILAILVGGTAYAHRELLDKTIHYLVTASIILITSLFIYLAYRFTFKTRRKKYIASIEDIDNMPGLEFEKFVAKLLEKRGFKSVRLTEKYDLGVDIIALKDGVTWGVQVKRYSGLVKANAIRQVVTALKTYKCDRAMVITNSYFSKVAVKLAKSNNCILLDRDYLIFNRRFNTNF